MVQSNFLNPMSLAYSLKHWRHMSKPYFRMRPCRFEQARHRREPWPYLRGREYQISSKTLDRCCYLPTTTTIVQSTNCRMTIPKIMPFLISTFFGQKVNFFLSVYFCLDVIGEKVSFDTMAHSIEWSNLGFLHTLAAVYPHLLKARLIWFDLQ